MWIKLFLADNKLNGLDASDKVVDYILVKDVTSSAASIDEKVS